MKLSIRRKVAIGFVALSIILGIVTAMGITWYWMSLTMHHDLDVIGIEGGLYQATYDGYRSKIDASDVDGNGEVFLTILTENFYNITLQIQVNNAPVGLIVNATGEWACVWHNTNGDKDEVTRGIWETLDLDDAININYANNATYYKFTDTSSTDANSKQRLMYKTLEWNDVDKYPPVVQDINVLIVQLIFDTEYVSPAKYTADVTFLLGIP